MTAARDLRGYGGQPPEPAWPGGARVAVSIVVNVEEGAELSVSDGDERNETAHEIPHEIVGVPNGAMDSHFEYGTRAGYWRIMDALAAVAAPATLSACGRAIERSPWLARDGIARGHEMSCHSWRWEGHDGMDEATERATIARTATAITAAAGVMPVGWHTKSACSANTRRLLVEHGDFLYDSDSYNDDLPYFVPVAGRRHLVVPYSFDTNDMHFHQGRQKFVTASHFSECVIDAFDCLWREGAHAPKMMSIGLHLRIIGRPSRIDGLRRVLTHIRDRGHTWIARRDAIAHHWIDRFAGDAT
jgi:peptidoglycan/xylan/chitin deacetylase (PgdA/CDA1 family)